jgi:hypothetical protein
MGLEGTTLAYRLYVVGIIGVTVCFSVAFVLLAIAFVREGRDDTRARLVVSPPRRPSLRVGVRTRADGAAVPDVSDDDPGLDVERRQ